MVSAPRKKMLLWRYTVSCRRTLARRARCTILVTTGAPPFNVTGSKRDIDFRAVRLRMYRNITVVVSYIIYYCFRTDTSRTDGVEQCLRRTTCARAATAYGFTRTDRPTDAHAGLAGRFGNHERGFFFKFRKDETDLPGFSPRRSCRPRGGRFCVPGPLRRTRSPRPQPCVL